MLLLTAIIQERADKKPGFRIGTKIAEKFGNFREEGNAELDG